MNNLIFSNNNRSASALPPDKAHKKKKIDIKRLKNNTFKSLYEVEYFLNNFHKFTNYIKLYKILKWSSKMDIL